MGDYAVLWRTGSVCPVIVIQGYSLRFMSPPFLHKSPFEIQYSMGLTNPICTTVPVSLRLWASGPIQTASFISIFWISRQCSCHFVTGLHNPSRYLSSSGSIPMDCSPVDTTLGSHSASGVTEHGPWMLYHNLSGDCGSTCFVNFPC